MSPNLAHTFVANFAEYLINQSSLSLSLKESRKDPVRLVVTGNLAISKASYQRPKWIKGKFEFRLYYERFL